MQSTRRSPTALVTGGSNGIGAAAAVDLAYRGYAVTVIDPGVGVDGAVSDTAPASLPAYPDLPISTETVSVTDAGGLTALVDSIVRERGSVDVVVNAAGIRRATNVAEMSADDWHVLLAVHLGGYLNVLGAVLPHMIAQGSGRVVGVSSGAGLTRPVPYLGYGVAKRAVAECSAELAASMPPGISINTVSPVAATRMIPQTGTVSTALNGPGLPLPGLIAPAISHLGCATDLTGQVLFSAGSELAWIELGLVLESVGSASLQTYSGVAASLRSVFLPAHTAQASTGGALRRQLPQADGRPLDNRRCLLVARPSPTAQAVASALTDSGLYLRQHAGEPTTDFDAVERILSAEPEPPDCVVVIGREHTISADGPAWQQVVQAGPALTDMLTEHAVWTRAAARLGARATRVVHVPTAGDGTNALSRILANSVAQLGRCAMAGGRPPSLECFTVVNQTANQSDRQALAALVSVLAADARAPELGGAQLRVRPGCVQLVRHPFVRTSISLSNSELLARPLPDWLDSLAPPPRSVPVRSAP